MTRLTHLGLETALLHTMRQDNLTQTVGPLGVTVRTGMKAIGRHTMGCGRLGVPVHGALFLTRQQTGQEHVHFQCPPAHEPTQGLGQRHAAMHRRYGTVHQKVGLEAMSYQLSQLGLPLHPSLR